MTLTVRQFPPDQYYWSLIGADLFAGLNARAKFQFLIGPRSKVDGSHSNREIIDSIKGSPPTGIRENAIGDKECFHHNYVGDLTFFPFPVTLEPASASELMPRFKATGTRKAPSGGITSNSDVRFTSIIEPGVDNTYTVPFDSRNGNAVVGDGWGTVYYRIQQVGDNLIEGYAYNYYMKEASNTYQYCDVRITNWSFSADMSKHIKTIVLVSASKTAFATNLSRLWSEQPSRLGTPTAPVLDRYDFGSTNQTIESIKHAIDTVLGPDGPGFLYPALIPDHFGIWGDLVQNCIDRLDYVNVNVIQFILELRDIKKLLPKIGKLTDPKTYANAWLWFKYGITLTISDTKALAAAIGRALGEAKHMLALQPEVSYASRSYTGTLGSLTYEDTYHYKIVSSRFPSDIMIAINDMTRWGVYPTLTNAWDMVPFSFVVDWFLPVQSLLERLDTQTQLQYYDILAVCRSRKRTVFVPPSSVFTDVAASGSLAVVDYRREVPVHVDRPVARIDSPGSFSNWAEAAALIIQRKR